VQERGAASSFKDIVHNRFRRHWELDAHKPAMGAGASGGLDKKNNQDQTHADNRILNQSLNNQSQSGRPVSRDERAREVYHHEYVGQDQELMKSWYESIAHGENPLPSPALTAGGRFQ